MLLQFIVQCAIYVHWFGPNVLRLCLWSSIALIMIIHYGRLVVIIARMFVVSFIGLVHF